MVYDIRDVIRDELQGKATHVPKDVRKYRIDICTVCPHFLKITRQCNICGCFMDAKIVYAETVCADTPPRWTSV